jgi:hypothetical protein
VAHTRTLKRLVIEKKHESCCCCICYIYAKQKEKKRNGGISIELYIYFCLSVNTKIENGKKQNF